jgi:hypothetical protein
VKMLLLPLAFLAPSDPDCASELILHGLGAAVAAQVAPYALCLDSTIGTQAELLSTCRTARAEAASYHGPARTRAKVERTVRWLDAMTRFRERCETSLKVRP